MDWRLYFKFGHFYPSVESTSVLTTACPREVRRYSSANDLVLCTERRKFWRLHPMSFHEHLVLPDWPPTRVWIPYYPCLDELQVLPNGTQQVPLYKVFGQCLEFGVLVAQHPKGPCRYTAYHIHLDLEGPWVLYNPKEIKDIYPKAR